MDRLDNVENAIRIIGTVDSIIGIYQCFGERLYEGYVKVQRKSGTIDYLMFNVSERILGEKCIVGKRVEIEGEIRTRNLLQDGKNHLLVYIFVGRLEITSKGDDDNQVTLKGNICKIGEPRLTPFGRRITDFTIAINRRYGKSSYIPCIVWGRNAQWLATLLVGEKISLEGRFQSRNYLKGTETKTAYEVSVATVRIS